MSKYALTLNVVNWAAEECARQHSGELSVARMVLAWQIAVDRCHRTVQESDIIILAKIIEPEKNANGYRNTPVIMGDTPALTASLIPSAIKRMIACQPEIGSIIDLTHGVTVNPADEWFKHFEEVHPFIDGNGRVGSIIYNWLNHSLDNPVAPPDFWS